MKLSENLALLMLMTFTVSCSNSSPGSSLDDATKTACRWAATAHPAIDVRAEAVTQAQNSQDAELRGLAENEWNEVRTATSVLPTDDGVAPVAKRYDKVYAWCQAR